MKRLWPDTLPGISLPNNSLNPIDPSRRTDMEVGPKRARRITFARADTVQANWLFTDREFGAFRAWHGEEPWSLTGHSEDLSDWTQRRLTVSPDAALGPAGQLASLSTEDSSTNTRFAEYLLPVIDDNQSVWMTATLKAAGRSQVRLSILDRAATVRQVSCDLSDGSVISNWDLETFSIRDRGNGWWRVAFVSPAGAGITTPQARIQLIGDTGYLNYTGNGTSGVLICEANVRRKTGHDLFLPTSASGDAFGAAGGSAWFETRLPFGGGFKTVQSRFEGPFTATARPGLNWNVSARMETRNA